LAVVLIRRHACRGAVSASAPDIMETRKGREFRLKFLSYGGLADSRPSAGRSKVVAMERLRAEFGG
jgi:hypothetical protein